jgi:hypothetical protein
VTADIVNLDDYRIAQAADADIDLVTAVDVAVRDLREVLSAWGTAEARQRLQQCEVMLTRAYFATDVDIDQPRCR